MGQLLFKKCFWQPIRDGSKRTTIRRWLRPRLKAAQRAFAPGVGWLVIDSIEPITLNSLTAAHARADGFKSVRELRQTLRELYPDRRTDNRTWFLISFHATS
jgi:hypothetical protein